MEEIEVPLEKSHEDIHEAAHHAKESWIGRVALFSALVAVIAAVAALLAGHHSNEAMIDQIKASNSWNYYQAKGIKASLLQTKNQILTELAKKSQPEDLDKLEEYKKQQDEISAEAKEHQDHSAHHLKIHEVLAQAVTFFQVAIAVSAISVLTRRRRFWLVGIAFSLIGCFFFLQGLFFT